MSYEDKTIYIDGEPRKIIVDSGAWIHVDSPGMPGRPCSQHGLSTNNLRYIFDIGGGLRTGGCTYASRPNLPTTLDIETALMPKRKTPLGKRIKAAIRAFKNA